MPEMSLLERQVSDVTDNGHSGMREGSGYRPLYEAAILYQAN
jgi:hypothetical protein